MKGYHRATRPGEGLGNEEAGSWPTPPVFLAENPPPPRFMAGEVLTPVSSISGKFSSVLRTRGLGRASHRWAGGAGKAGEAVPGQGRGCREVGVSNWVAHG